MNEQPIVRLTSITKSFLGVPVLRGVDLELRAGEVHALMGENGAGKSTLLKVLAGVHRPDGGSIELDGTQVTFTAPRDAQRAGIAIIHQEFNLLAHRSVAENVYLGREPVRRGQVDRKKMNADTAELLDWLGEEGIRPDDRIADLPVARQQVVEILKALSTQARVIAMDEPTAALADHEVELLYDLIRRLRERGIAILYVSHRMREVYDLSQRITVLKDGAFVTTAPAADITPEQLVRHMVGRPLDGLYPARAVPADLGDERLALRDAGNDRVRGLDFRIRAGEIVGLAGLQGSGRSAVARAIWGVEPLTRGTLLLDGHPQRIRGPRAAVRRRIAFVTEDRKGEGLALRQSVRDNTLMVRRAALSGGTSRVHKDIADLLRSVTVVSRGEHQEVRLLSGGNQQKVVLAKWLAIGPRVLIVDEPTRGIDVGAKQAVHTLLRDLARTGVAVLMISSELPELIGMSDRILVMHEGRLAGELPAGATEEAVMALATGHRTGEAA
ncbi:sugar ABC transporter ATP-binding protein [Streptomyces sp. NBC_00873]|uniref:sugar ABC transporter ATP-binding protein n=1 Tax=unclassified Streptomyces TaxID=2593676 RepID=UPI00386E42DE|nr:sugar ABC transporter ATP-binding protein [Streptomyces sp. NBC_00873]WTA43984.1 sugar ABC transporter ATP-binding protein [Streptomyces sp. NBC_00842]